MSDDPRDEPTLASVPEEEATRSAHGSASLSAWPGPAAPTLQAGHCFGRYRVVRLLGRGGMGEVYEAEDLDSGRRLALKLLSRIRPSDQDRRRFLREGRLAASISHPNCVYVFGTAAIDESLVMTMELVSGGSLRDRVAADGPLEPGRAVDLIVQAARGLQTAHLSGILHRDIKPSNLFVDAKGQIKVGDFGLSISMTASEETHLTATGTFLGTPSYASPEQMRGEEGDVRADIYSLGATLYYLLTGRPPFEADNPVNLVAAVLQDTPPSPAAIRPELPKGLAQVVLRCLEKKPAGRFADYHALLAALTPYGSAAPTPANPRARLFATALDWIGYGALATIPQATGVYGIRVSPAFILLHALIWIGFWFLLDATGGSPGKWLLATRVVGPDGHRPASWRALVRASIFGGLPMLPLMILSTIIGEQALLRMISEGSGTFVSLTPLVATLALMLTARRRNGFAGLHELTSGTRVVIRPAHETRPTFARQSQAEVAPTGERCGVYAVLEAQSPVPGMDLVQGYDEQLHRRVWIHRREPGEDSIDSARRDLDRPARLRWLDGGRAEPHGWDAYEAPAGRSLAELIEHRHRWHAVRYWLLDLAVELEAAVEDGSLGSQTDLADIWITADGRVRVLDFRRSGAGGQDTARLDTAGAQRLLARVAMSALEGRPVSHEQPSRTAPGLPLPLAARALLTRLANAEYADLASAAQDVRALTKARPAGSRGSRAAQLAIGLGAVAFFPSMILLTGWIMFGMAGEMARLRALGACATRLERSESLAHLEGARGVRERQALQVVMAWKFADLAPLTEPAVDSLAEMSLSTRKSFARSMLKGHDPEEIAGILRMQPPPTAEDAEQALLVLGDGFLSELDRHETSAAGQAFAVRVGILVVSLAIVVVGSLLVIVLALVTRGGPILRLFGAAVVTSDGAPASRMRVLARASLAWLPAVMAAVTAFLVTLKLGDGGATAAYWILAGIAAWGLLGSVFSAATPDRGPHDRLVGTHLVPR